MNLAGFDLNLLRALHVLLDEGHIGRAARRLGITGPAASNTLRRLREQFDDPLLVRSGNVMVRSPLAERLQTPLARLMADTELLLRGAAAFDPRTHEGAFHIGTSDHVISALLVQLDAALFHACARADLRVHRVPRDPVAWLESEGDLVLGALEPDTTVLHSEPLFEDRFVCLLACDHPLAHREWSVEEYAALDHVLITPRGLDSTGVVDDALAERDLSRRVALTVPSFWVAPMLVAGSGRVVTLPARYASRSLAGPDAARRIVVKRPPLPLPTIEIRMIWHARVEEDSRHRWLREQVSAVARALPGLDDV